MTAVDLAEAYAALVAAEPADLLEAVVEASGGRLRAAAREDVAYRPGRSASVRLAAEVERDGVVGREGWVVHAEDPLPAGTLVLEGPAGAVAVWRVRDDPALPGLRPALDVQAVGGMLRALGLPSDGVVLELLAYRPQRRAVVSASTPTHRVFLKCVPPGRVGALHARHAACREVGLPVPHPLGVDERLGLLPLTPLHGQPLRGSLMRPAAALPSPADVIELVARFAEVRLQEPARAPVRQARGHAALLRTVLPAAAGEVDDLLAGVAAAEDADEPPVVVHGDLYDQQLLVVDGTVTGVVDVDGAGLGHRADDVANLLAHLLVLAEVAPADRGVHAWLPAVAAQARDRHDLDQLRQRTAAVLLGLATWPHSRRSDDWELRTRQLLSLTARVLRDGP